MKQEVIQKAEEKPKQRGPNLTGIPTQMKLDFEQCSGLSFDDVRVHYNSDKPRKIGALAYTQIPQVHIGPGNESKLSHELGHVIQQKMEPIAPTITLNGFQINASPYMESDADSPFTMRENLQFSSSPLQTKSTVIQCSFVEGESLRDILKNQYELQIKLLPLKNADESLFVQPGEPNYSVDKLATYSDSLVHESSGNSQETAAHEIPTNVNSTTVPTEFAGIDNLKIFFNGKIAPFTTVGFEHEFARWPKQNKNSFSGIIHVKLGYSKTEWSYTGERFSLETDSGDKIELESPPLLVETDF